MNSCVEDHSTHIVIIFSFRPHGLTCFISDTLLPQNADPPTLFLQSSIRYSAPIHHPKPENECLVLCLKTRREIDLEPHIATSERIYRDHPTTAARRCRGPLAIAPPEQVHRRPESLEQRGVSGCDHVGPKPHEQVTTSGHTRLHDTEEFKMQFRNSSSCEVEPNSDNISKVRMEWCRAQERKVTPEKRVFFFDTGK
jgi:hypothetical protein